MNAAESARSYFQNGYNCSQSVLAAYAESLGLPEETAIRLATGFGIGLSHGATCGAVSGAVMVLGLLHGGGGPDGGEAKQNVYAMSQEFMETFTERFGSTVCSNIIGCDPSTAEGLKKARDNGLFKTVCLEVVGRAAEILEEMK